MAGRELCLPWPPSVNHYYVRTRRGMAISKAGREYRAIVAARVLEGRCDCGLAGDLAIEIDAYPPDRRRRDLDNINKAMWDAIQHAGVYADDSQIKEMRARMLSPIPGGKVDVRLYEIENP